MNAHNAGGLRPEQRYALVESIVRHVTEGDFGPDVAELALRGYGLNVDAAALDQAAECMARRDAVLGDNGLVWRYWPETTEMLGAHQAAAEFVDDQDQGLREAVEVLARPA